MDEKVVSGGRNTRPNSSVGARPRSSSSSASAKTTAAGPRPASGRRGVAAFSPEDDDEDTLFRPCRKLLKELHEDKNDLKFTQQDVSHCLKAALERAKSDSCLSVQFRRTMARGGRVGTRERTRGGGRASWVARRIRESEPLQGPKKFYDDRSTWTGTARNGGPDILGDPEERPVTDLSEVMRPGLRSGGTYFPPSLQPLSAPAKAQVQGVTTVPLLKKKQQILLNDMMFAATVSGLDPTRLTLAPEDLPRGPERFFYDTSSFTGTHRFGGPDRVVSGKFRGCHADVVPYPCRDKAPIF